LLFISLFLAVATKRKLGSFGCSNATVGGQLLPKLNNCPHDFEKKIGSDVGSWDFPGLNRIDNYKDIGSVARSRRSVCTASTEIPASKGLPDKCCMRVTMVESISKKKDGTVLHACSYEVTDENQNLDIVEVSLIPDNGGLRKLYQYFHFMNAKEEKEGSHGSDCFGRMAREGSDLAISIYLMCGCKIRFSGIWADAVVVKLPSVIFTPTVPVVKFVHKGSPTAPLIRMPVQKLATIDDLNRIVAKLEDKGDETEEE